MAGLQMNIRIEHAGLTRALKDPELVRGPIRDFHEQVGLEMVRQVKDFSPVDTGRMRSSWRHRVRRSAGDILSKGGVSVGTPVRPYPRILETARIGKFKPRGVGRIPFLRPAIEEVEKNEVPNLLKALGRAIQRRFRKPRGG